MFLRFAAAAVSLIVLPSVAPALSPPATLPPPPAALVLVQAKPDPLGAHAAIEWAKERLLEIDATVATLEEDAGKLHDDIRKRADEIIAKLRATRDAYGAKIEGVLADGRQQTESMVAETRAALETQWSAFERDLEGYLTSINSEIALRKEVFQARMKAEEAYWRQRIADLKASTSSVAAKRRAALEARIAAVQAEADAAKARLARLQQAGGDAWSALRDGLAEARGVFDKTYEAVRGAIERARQ
jgi:DNA repair exonuclease SbcCD ATPase subunit